MNTKLTDKITYQIPVGPIHPALKEPVQFEFKIEGEDYYIKIKKV